MIKHQKIVLPNKDHLQNVLLQSLKKKYLPNTPLPGTPIWSSQIELTSPWVSMRTHQILHQPAWPAMFANLSHISSSSKWKQAISQLEILRRINNKQVFVKQLTPAKGLADQEKVKELINPINTILSVSTSPCPLTYHHSFLIRK